MVPGKLKQLVDHDPGGWRQRPRIIAAPGWVLFGAVLLTILSAAPAQDEQAELEAVRARIEALEARISAQRSAMDAERQALQDIEARIGAQHAAIERSRRELAAEQARLEELNAAVATSRVELSTEHDALARQVLLSYTTGREALLKLVLNQESPTALGRMVTYYDFFNEFRSNRIESVRGQLEELAALMRAARESEQRFADLTAEREAELAELESSRAQRNAMISAQQSRLSESGQALESLRDDEQRLTDLVVELGDILTAFPAGSQEPFASLKGRLAWPASGSIEGRFGELRDGGPLRWNGVLVDAEPGSMVRAIHHGRVAFSDWLPNFGLLMIVDHGDGYLSVYGHNEVLLRESGEWVAPGDELAQVGSDGGRAGLYFELRHNGDAIDPSDWMR
jgi:septal ring factor EnvC (AmiA/AmiB activator)